MRNKQCKILICILLFFVHPPGSLLLSAHNELETKNNSFLEKQIVKIPVTNTFAKDLKPVNTVFNKEYHNDDKEKKNSQKMQITNTFQQKNKEEQTNNKTKDITEEIREFLYEASLKTKKGLSYVTETISVYSNQVYTKIHPYMSTHYLQVIAGLLLLCVIILLFRGHLYIKKKIARSAKKEKEDNVKNYPEKYYSADQISDEDKEQPVISLMGRKNKKPKLEVDYTSLFNPGASGQNKQKKLLKEKEKSFLPNNNNILYDLTNHVSSEEKFKNRYYTNHLENAYNEDQAFLIKEKENNTNAPLYYSLDNFNTMYNSYLHQQTYNPQTTNEYNVYNNQRLTPHIEKPILLDNDEQDIDIFEVLGEKKTEKKEDNNAKVLLTTDIFSTHTSNVSNSITKTSDTTNFNTVIPLSPHDDFMDFFSDVQKQDAQEEAKKEEKISMTQEKEETKDDRRNSKTLKKEFESPMEKIPEEIEDDDKDTDYKRKDSHALLKRNESFNESCEKSDIKESFDSSHLDHSSDVNEDDEDRVIKKLKKMNIRRCMIKTTKK